ncbi:MAG: aminotransferase class I/II-fold pyridoxal phosphate-dependent enzyme, partial [Candidatus Hodarchaeota archaeon]
SREDQDDFAHTSQMRTKKALEEGKTKYSSNNGIPELREALATKYATDYSINYDYETEICVTCGALEALFNVACATFEPGDEFLTPDPDFSYFTKQATMLGAKEKRIPLDKKFKIQPEDIEKEITPKTKLIHINFPSNPTGSVMSRNEIKRIVDIAAEHDLILLSDEAYEKIVYEGHTHTCVAEFGYENTIIIGSFSKSYAMTGFRLGYVCAPASLMPSIAKVHQLNTACANTAAQWAAYTGVNSPDLTDSILRQLIERRDAGIDKFGSIPGISIDYDPLGAFYIFPNVSGTGMDGTEFSKFCLEKAGVVVVPGIEFGRTGKDHVRISYGSASPGNIQLAADKIQQILS